MSYKKDFIKFMCDAGVLTFGEFTLKSGRKAPYFINTGNYKTGEHIAKLGEFYAQVLLKTVLTLMYFMVQHTRVFLLLLVLLLLFTTKLVVL